MNRINVTINTNKEKQLGKLTQNYLKQKVFKYGKHGQPQHTECGMKNGTAKQPTKVQQLPSGPGKGRTSRVKGCSSTEPRRAGTEFVLRSQTGVDSKSGSEPKPS